jgi:erythromycin esterase-like protein/predicted phosphoribosyltransferase
MPVAAEIAKALHAPLDVFLVRKIGVPGHPELAMGAVAEGGVRVLSGELIRQLGIPKTAVDQVAARERLELERRDVQYRSNRRPPPLADRIVILVDDGLATGSTMEAAIMALRERKPAQIIVAAPVGAAETVQRLRRLADDVVCANVPPHFGAVGEWYERFDQTSDEEVIQLLAPAADAGPLHSTQRTANPGSLNPGPLEVVRHHARPMTGAVTDYDEILKATSGARVVLIGEATHGTHEFYRERAVITKRLIAEQGFSAVAVEADWPDAYRVNRYVRAVSDDDDATVALSDFKRFPSWMWRNADVLDFVGWLRAENDRRPAAERAGFYGLDLYSLHASMRAVIAFLDQVDPAAAAQARSRYACFDRFGDEMQAYARSAAFGWEPGCEREVLSQLTDLRRQAAEYARRDGRLSPDAVFVAEQNARVVANAEAYYRTMFGGRVESWNLRDRHMADTLDQLLQHLRQSGRPPRVVVWAHNSHIGDARATEMGDQGELNIGQLARERFGKAAVAIGFTTHAGTVTAASEWDGPARRRQVRPSLPGSIERLFHDVATPRFILPLRTDASVAAALDTPRLERAIGVLYMPESERRSHYFHARVASQFDFVVHIDQTRAVEPLERTSVWDEEGVLETYPSGL